MKKDKNIDALFNSIPKEYHKTLFKIAEYFHDVGVKEVQDLLINITSIQPNEIHEYGVFNSNELDGG